MERVIYIQDKTICPYCLGYAKHKRTVDTEYSGDIEIYECQDCGKSSEEQKGVFNERV